MIDESWYQRPDGVPEDVSAGGIVVRRDGNHVYVALAQERLLGAHVLPKGGVEPGETYEQAAAREIEEEVGITDLTMVTTLGTKERLSLYKSAWKVTHYFLYTTEQVDATPTDNEAHDAMIWHPVDDTREIFWPEQRDLIRESRGLIDRAFD